MAAEHASVAGAGWATRSVVPPKTGAASAGPEGAVLVGVVLGLVVALLAVAAVLLPGDRPGRPPRTCGKPADPDPESDTPPAGTPRPLAAARVADRLVAAVPG